MGANCYKPDQIEIEDTEPVPFNADNDKLWQKLNDIKKWKLAMDGVEKQHDLVAKGQINLLQELANDSAKLGEIISQADVKQAEVATFWARRQFSDVERVELEFKILYKQAEVINLTYTGGVTPQNPPHQPPQNPVTTVPPSQPQRTSTAQTEGIIPGAAQVGEPYAPPHPRQPPNPATQFNTPPPNPTETVPPNPPPKPAQPYQAPVYNTPPPRNPAPVQQQVPYQSPPVQPVAQASVPVQQAPLTLDPRMAKAARVYKISRNIPGAKTELRKNDIENMFAEMVAIIENSQEKYEAAKAAREEAERQAASAAPAPPAQPAGGPPAVPFTGGPPHAPQVTAPMHAPPAGGPTHRPPPTGPAPGAPSAGRTLTFQEQIAARSHNLQHAENRPPTTNPPPVANTKNQSNSLLDNVQIAFQDAQDNDWMHSGPNLSNAKSVGISNEEWND